MSRQRSMETIARGYVTIEELVRLTDVRYSTLKFIQSRACFPLSRQRKTSPGAIAAPGHRAHTPASKACVHRAGRLRK